MTDITKVIARAWSDPDYKARLLRDPRAALAEAGIDVSADIRIKVLEDTTDITHVVLPMAPADADGLSTEELEKVAGGIEQERAGWPN